MPQHMAHRRTPAPTTHRKPRWDRTQVEAAMCAALTMASRRLTNNVPEEMYGDQMEDIVE